MTESEKLNLNSYYFSFDHTGVEAVDKILHAIARAGKAFHHTEGWSDPDYGTPTHAEKIQAAANEAAAAWNRRTEMKDGK